MPKIIKRRRGDVLQPGRFTPVVVRGLQMKSATYDPQYQQEPAPATGRIFNPSWWRYYKEMPEFEMVVLSVDCSFKGGKENDPVALLKFGVSGTRSYLIERETRVMGYIETKQAIRAMQKHGRRASVILVESKANGPAVIEELKADPDFGASVIAIDPGGIDKVARANAASVDCEAGSVFLPESSEWTTGFVRTFAGFPAVKHDDDVDALSQFINWRRGRNQAYGVLDWGKRIAGDIANGVRDLFGELIHKPAPKPTPAVVEIARVDNYDITREKPKACPNCGSGATIRLGAPQSIHCNQCSTNFLADGTITWRPPETIVGKNCCSNPLRQLIANVTRCVNCGSQTVPAGQPTNALTFRQLGRLGRGYMVELPEQRSHLRWRN